MQKDMRKYPENIYIDIRQYDDYDLPIIDVTIDTNVSGRYGLWTENRYGTGHPKNCNIEYIRADLVEPSYGAEKIIRGNGKVQDEYILTSLHDKKVEDFKQLAETYRRILNAKGTKAEEV